MATEIHGAGSGISGEPTVSEATGPKEGKFQGRDVNIQGTLLNSALASIKSHNTTMERYAKQIEANADNTNKSTNLLNRLDAIKTASGLSDSDIAVDWKIDDDASKKETVGKILEMVDDIATAVNVYIPPCVKECLSDFQKDQSRFAMKKETLDRLKTICKSVSDSISKLETQDQLRLNQAQTEHANTIKWIINVMSSFDRIIDKIIQMGDRR